MKSSKQNSISPIDARFLTVCEANRKSSNATSPPLKVGQIWKGKDFDGITEYEILITGLDPLFVHYILAVEERTPVRLKCSRSDFLLVYTTPRPSWTKPSSSSKTLWQELRAFFSRLGNF